MRDSRDSCDIKNLLYGPLYLAGSSIHFDRTFIKVHMPKLEQLLHYRMLDVSSFKIMEEFVGLPVFEPQGECRHRALSDMRGSIEMFRHYKDMLSGRAEALAHFAAVLKVSGSTHSVSS